MISSNSNFSRKKAYIVPDCQVHEFSYELMGNGIDTTSPPKPVTPDKPTTDPGLDVDEAKGYIFSYNVWEDGNL